MESYQETVQLIKSSKLKQTELARRSGLTPTAINRWLNGRVTSIRPSNVEAVAAALGKEVLWKNNGRTECEFRDAAEVHGGALHRQTASGLLDRVFELERQIHELQESRSTDTISKINWHVGFAGWLQVQFDLDYERESLGFPIRNIFDGTAYNWTDVIGFRKRDLIGKDWLEMLHPRNREQAIERSREVAQLYERTQSPIIETDRILKLRHARGNYVELFCHFRANLETRMAKIWCIPVPPESA